MLEIDNLKISEKIKGVKGLKDLRILLFITKKYNYKL